MDTYKIKDLPAFEASVFGADCLLDYFPKLKTEGMRLKKIEDRYYIVCDEGKTYDTCFLSEEEMSTMEKVQCN